MKKTIFLMAMMSAVALVSVSCRNGGDDKNEKSTETQIPIRKKILGKWYLKSLTMVSGNPATPPDEPTYYDENDCEAQSYWDFGGDRSGIITQHEYEKINGKCEGGIRRAEYYLTDEKGKEIMKYKVLAGDNPVWKNRVVKQITDKTLVLEWKEDINDDGAEDTMTFTLYRK